jgi:hypothetical protein
VLKVVDLQRVLDEDRQKQEQRPLLFLSEWPYAQSQSRHLGRLFSTESILMVTFTLRENNQEAQNKTSY